MARGGGPLCRRSRGTRNPTETQKSKIVLTCHFKYCFHFLGIKCLDYTDFMASVPTSEHFMASEDFMASVLLDNFLN